MDSINPEDSRVLNEVRNTTIAQRCAAFLAGM